MNDFASWLLNELEDRNWLPATLARKAGVSQGTVSSILNGSRNAGPDVCVKFAKALGYPPEKLLRVAGIIPNQFEGEEPRSLQEMIDLARTLTPDQREEAIRYIRYLLFEQRRRGGADTQKSPVPNPE